MKIAIQLLSRCTLLLGIAVAGCGSADVREASWFASKVVSVSYGPGQSFGRESMPAIALGPPKGGGCCQGSLDVVSLGNGGSIVLGFDRIIVDGAGTDFVVFENPFETGTEVFAELGTVAASTDGVSWRSFPCDATAPPYGTCGGWRPVHYHGADGPFDAASAGGDPFDLALVGLAEARYVRITDRADLEGPSGVFDLDAVGIVHATAAR